MNRDITYRGLGIDQANVADLLTFSRMAGAPLLAWLVAIRSLNVAVGVLGLAWCTDFFDGRLARGAERVTRLHRWDLRTDAWLAVCMVAGLGFGGYLSWWIVAPLVGLVFVELLLLSNPAPVALSVGALFGMFVWIVMRQGERLWWLPGVYVVIALAATRRRLFRVILPAVFSSLLALATGDLRRQRGIVLDDWVD